MSIKTLLQCWWVCYTFAAEVPMDGERAIQNIERYPYLPFVADCEVGRIFGPEVAQALRHLERISEERGICSDCGGRCCQQMGCELFAPEFGECPIHEYRPLLCRFHYCDRFSAENEGLIKELIDIFLSVVSRLEAPNRALSAIELNMMLYGSCRKPEEDCPQLVEEMRQIVAAAKGGEISWQRAKRILREEVKAYRNGKKRGESGLPSRGEIEVEHLSAHRSTEQHSWA